MSIMLMAASASDSTESMTAPTTGGALQGSKTVELQIDQATTTVNDAGTTRCITKAEVLLILELFERTIVKMDWPYAAS